jgi:DNA ligase-1
MSEKLDGLRGYWSGQKLMSRQGNPIPCPPGFTEGLPTDVTLDGELWIGQGTTAQDVLKEIRSKNSDWSKIKYYLFDIPSRLGTYEDRMKEMESFKSRLPSHVELVESIRCRGLSHLQEFLQDIVSKKGEGVVLRQPNTLNEKGYTKSFLKVKVSFIVPIEPERFNCHYLTCGGFSLTRLLLYNRVTFCSTLKTPK